MNVSRHVAKDMRSALTLVRDLHGPDAVILSNKKVPEGIEITAAIDYDETLLESNNQQPQDYTFPSIDKIKPAQPETTDQPQEKLLELEKQSQEKLGHLQATTDPRQTQHTTRSNQTPTFEFTPPESSSDQVDFHLELSNAARQASTDAERSLAPTAKQTNAIEDDSIKPSEEKSSKDKSSNKFEVESRPHSPEVIWTQANLMDDMRKELSSLKSLVEKQISGFAWGEMSRQTPVRAGVLRKLVALGLTPGVARHIAYRISEDSEHRQAWYRALAMLARQIPVAGDTILSQGGIIALVGPAGVGKTSLIAKLAVQYAARHGRKNIAMITTDSHRFGAFDQLKNLGSILKIPVRAVSTHAGLEAALDGFLEKELVLIDSAGLGHQDERLLQSLEDLKSSTPMLKAHMVLSATTQADALEQMIKAYKPIDPVACILTKLDESTSLGPVLSSIVEHKLPITYFSDGQKIPDNLKLSRVHDLVGKAVAKSKNMNTFDRADDITMEQIMMGDLR